MEVKQTIIKEDGTYDSNIDVTVEEWKQILRDEELVHIYKDALMKFYNEPEHRSSCKALSDKYNDSPQRFNARITQFSKAVQKRLNRFKMIGTDGKPTYWVISMTGKSFDGYFVWTLRPELVRAIEEIWIIKSNIMNNYENLLKANKNLILTGAPGVGKTYKTAEIAVALCDGIDKVPSNRTDLMKRYKELLAQKQISFTTFHQSLDYEEFVEGLKPNCKDGNVSYNVENGIFKAICERAKDSYASYEKANAKKTKIQNYVLIIDEINRGNISKIFGELITLLEKDKRLGEENEITVTLPYSQDTFAVPSNLYVIGTMNTADRSIGQIDYALRRRFAFVALKADKNVIGNYADYQDNTRENAEKLFDEIQHFISENINEDLDAEDLMVGHSYFLCKNDDELRQRLEYEIVPLLYEYQKDGILVCGKETLNAEVKKWKL